MGNKLKQAHNSQIYLAKLANHNMVWVHSPTYGPFWDGMRYGLGKLNVCTETVKEIKSLWYKYFKDHPDGYISWTCHSRGVLDTRNALKAFPEDLRERIVILAVAPGCFIDKSLCGSVTHLVSRDLVPGLSPIDMLRCWDTIKFVNPHPKAPVNDHPLLSPTYRPHIRRFYNKFSSDYQ